MKVRRAFFAPPAPQGRPPCLCIRDVLLFLDPCFHYQYDIVCSVALLLCFMMKLDIKKYLNIFVSFSGEHTPLILKNNVKIILDSKANNLSILRLNRILGIIVKKCVTLMGTELCIFPSKQLGR